MAKANYFFQIKISLTNFVNFININQNEPYTKKPNSVKSNQQNQSKRK